MKSQEFIDRLFSSLPEGAAPVVCGFPGDPNSTPRGAWKAYPARAFDEPPPLHNPFVALNTYVCVSSFYMEDGRFFRRKANFAALHTIMLDDLGSGIGSKISLDKLKLQPTAVIETSPLNYQAYFKLKTPIRTREYAEKVIKAMIKQGLLAEKDPGMDGVTRVGRLPEGINGKPKYFVDDRPWKVGIVDSNWACEYEIADIISAYGLRPDEITIPASKNDGIKVSAEDDPILRLLDELELVKGAIIDFCGSQKVDIICPWVDEHTDRSTSGTAYFVGGGFKCHHGHCIDRNFRDLLVWLTEQGHDTNGLVAKLEEEKTKIGAAKMMERIRALNGGKY